MVMFTAHLSITVKRLTIQAKNSFGCHFGGHTFALQNGGQILMSINHPTLLKNQSAIQYLP